MPTAQLAQTSIASPASDTRAGAASGSNLPGPLSTGSGQVNGHSKKQTNGVVSITQSKPSEQQSSALDLTAHENLDALASILPPGATSDPELLNQYLQLLQHLLDMKVPPEQWPDVIAALNDQVQATKETSQVVQEAPPTVAPEPEVEVQQPSKEVVKSALPAKPHTAKAKREQHARRRSRSPVRRVRGSPDYGPQNRQRSPQRTISPTLQADKIPLSTKWTGFDRSLPDGHIKVLSRTLFVSGVSCTPEELKSLFAQFGEVQSCTFDARKRQAFLKIVTRAGAEKSKEAMSDPNSTLR